MCFFSEPALPSAFTARWLRGRKVIRYKREVTEERTFKSRAQASAFEPLTLLAKKETGTIFVLNNVHDSDDADFIDKMADMPQRMQMWAAESELDEELQDVDLSAAMASYGQVGLYEDGEQNAILFNRNGF